MKKVTKNILLVIFAILVGVGVAGSGAVLVARLQESKDRNTIRVFVENDKNPKRLAGNQSISERIACQPSPGQYGECPALQYKVSPEECLEILRTFESKKQACFGGKDVQYNGRSLQLHFGSVYERQGTYVQIAMNEKNLFWKFL